ARFILANPAPSNIPAETEGLALNDDHPVIGKVAARAHPGLLTLERRYDERSKKFRTELTVDVIRRTLPFFGTTAGEGAWRIAVVDAADEMNHNAANALLKILEEPPPRSLFLIVSHAPGRLLPTIRSRCRRLDIPVLQVDQVQSALVDHGVAADMAGHASLLAEGSLRRAAAYCQGDAMAVYREFTDLAGQLPDMNIDAVHAFADRVAARGRDDHWSGFVDLLGGWLNRRVRGLAEPHGGPALTRSVVEAPLERWAEVWENLRRDTTEADTYNLDRKRTVLRIMLLLSRAARM
ncbi:MAG: DNA polymerase III subunit delta', partial [Alphaproteobacteria bacterium]